MKNKYCLYEKDWQKAKAALLLAKNFGLILDDSLEALEERRKEKNEENRHKQEKGELFYGPCFYTPPMYLQYELTRFRLDFVQPSENNHDLFGRYHGDYFPFEDVEQIIEKRLREEAYDKLIQNILCQSD